MSQRYFMHLAYLGAPFHGWQVQPGEVTVQGTIEESLKRLTGQTIAVTGAGRTDAGVNARHMTAHIDLPDEIKPNVRFLSSLNALCGRAIAVQRLEPVMPEAHARFDATERTYRYFVHTGRDPFSQRLSWQAPPTLDFEAMNQAASLMIGQRDFTSFSKLHTDVRTNICDLRYARWHRGNGAVTPGGVETWYFEIKADRFLRNMVRAVVGTLVEVGRGKMRAELVVDILNAMDRCAAGTSMPPDPLFLWEVKY